MDKKEKSYKIENIQIKDYVIENLRKKICDFAFITSQLNRTNVNNESYKNCSYYKESEKQ